MNNTSNTNRLTKEVFYVSAKHKTGKQYTRDINPNGKRILYYTLNKEIAQNISKTGGVVQSCIVPYDLRMNSREMDRFIFLAK